MPSNLRCLHYGCQNFPHLRGYCLEHKGESFKSQTKKQKRVNPTKEKAQIKENKTEPPPVIKRTTESENSSNPIPPAGKFEEEEFSKMVEKPVLKRRCRIESCQVELPENRYFRCRYCDQSFDSDDGFTYY